MRDLRSVGGAEPLTVWRVSVAGRMAAVLVAVVLVMIGVLVPVGLADEGLPLRSLDVVVAVVIAALAVPVLVAAFRARVILLPASLVVVNPLGRQTCALTDITGVEPGWGGLAIDLADGETITVWAVQRTNIARWLSVPSRADRVAAEIRRAAGL